MFNNMLISRKIISYSSKRALDFSKDELKVNDTEQREEIDIKYGSYTPKV